MRVAFTLLGDKSGTGVYNYLLNLARLLTRYQHEAISSVLFVGTDTPPQNIAPFAEVPGVEIVHSRVFDESRKTRSQLMALLLGRDRAMCQLFTQYEIDVAFESARFFGRRLNVPAIAWIPDFQHKELPHLFTTAGYWKRELGFRAQVQAGRTIMLSSEDSRRACERHYPASVGRTHTVHFAVPAGPIVGIDSAKQIAAEYGLPESFYFLPNQFWRHKNHLLVLQSLAQLQSEGLNVVVAASGKQEDSRDSSYFPEVLATIERLKLQDSFRLLGHVPYAHLLELITASTALLNPSCFEGWSTSVEEARALGVPMILSDLEVHREQAGQSAVYFDRTSPSALAMALRQFVPRDRDTRAKMAEDARAESQLRVERYAREFSELLKQCVDLDV